LALTTYYYVITALTATGGQTQAGAEASITLTGSNDAVSATWPAVTGAATYRIYRGLSAGNENVYYTSATNSFTDQGNAATAGSPPALNTAFISGTTIFPYLLPTPTAATLGGVFALASTPNEWIDSILPSGAPHASQPGFSNLSGSASDSQLANAYSGVGACAANTWASTLTRNSAPSCSQPGFGNLSGTASDSQLANAYSGVGTCGAGTWASTLSRNAAPSCTGLPGVVDANKINGASVPASPTSGFLSSNASSQLITGTHIAIPGTTSTDSASLGPELTGASGWTSTGWTGSYGAGFTNGALNTLALSYTVAGMGASQYYDVCGTITGSSAGSLTLSLGGATVNSGPWNVPYWSGNHTWCAGVFTVSNAAFTITPTSNFVGTFGTISVKLVTPISTFNLVAKDSTAANSWVASQQLASNHDLFIGPASGIYNLGVENVALGVNALASNLTGYNNTAVGFDVLQQNTSGSQNTAVGHAALQANTSGWYNAAFGQLALGSNLTGYANAAFCEGSLQDNTTGYFNAAFGCDALFNNVGGYQNTALGRNALNLNVSGNTNVAVGEEALDFNTASGNTGVGFLALYSNSSGVYNSAVGFQSLKGTSMTGSYNTAAGYNTLLGDTTGQNNVAVGNDALTLNTTGNYNTAAGNEALAKVTTNGFNAAFGNYALNANTAADNTAVGSNAGAANTSGASNVYVGYYAGQANPTTGAGNTLIGASTVAPATSTANCTALGYQATCTGSNQFVAGNSSVTDAFMGGVPGASAMHAALFQGGQDTSSLSTLPNALFRGSDQTGTGGAASIAGNVYFRGGNNAGTSGTSQAGSVELTPGMSTAGGQQGLLVIGQMYNQGAGTETQWNLQCVTAAAMTVQDCGASPTKFTGVGDAHTGAVVQVHVPPSQTPVNASAAVTLGNTVCAGSTAGKVTDSGGTDPCTTGITVGKVLAVSGVYVFGDGVSTTLSTTLPLIQLYKMWQVGTGDFGANSVNSSKMAVVNTRRTCVIDNNTQSATALTAAQFSGRCTVSAAGTIVEIDVLGGTGVLTGTPAAPTVTGTGSVQVGIYRPSGSSPTDAVMSAQLASASGQACALPTAGAAICGIMGIRQAGASLSITTTALLAGDVLYASAATADAAQTWYQIAIHYTVN
jgi:hypothetical protein